MLRLKSKNFFIYLAFFFLVNSTLALNESPEYLKEDETDTEPIKELYINVSPDYMKGVINDLISLSESYVFSDIMKAPPEPYNESGIDIKEELENITNDEPRPFYEFYRDVKKTFSKFRDSNFEILGQNITLNGINVNFEDYRICLPFKFYIDKKEDDDKNKIYIKEYPECSQYFNESDVELIREANGSSVKSINGIDPFEFIKNFGSDFYDMKNPNSGFALNIDSLHDTYLNYVPILPKELNTMTLIFDNDEILNTHYHVLKEPEEETEKENKVKNAENDIPWDIISENKEIRCRADKEKELNVLFMNSLLLEESGDITIDRCASLFYSNDYRLVIITSQLWEGENNAAYHFAQALFPKIDVKFNMAMKQTELNEQLFKEDKSKVFLDPIKCTPYEKWEDFVESKPDEYEGDVKHYRTKIYNPIPKDLTKTLNDFREEIQKLGHNKKSTDIIILTDTVMNGPPSNFLKTIQNNGAAIVASYGGNPNNSPEYIKTLDASMEPVDITNYENTEIYTRLSSKGFVITNIPFAESFESYKKNQYPMDFIVNPVDEVTNIYHFYDDQYYDEFIGAAKDILDKYNSSCNKDNLNLVLENDECVFIGDFNAHGGYKCNSQGEWSKECKKSYCEIGYFYDKASDKCKRDKCITQNTEPISELYEEVSPDYMKTLINDLLELLDSYVFSDIIQNPPEPYNEYKFDYKTAFNNTDTDEERPFYDFFRDIRQILSYFKDAFLDIIAGEVPLSSGKVNLNEYNYCLPFIFYLDNKADNEIKVYIKEYPDCSKYYNDSIKESIYNNRDQPVIEINGRDVFDYLQNYQNEFYKLKNPNSFFQFELQGIHERYLAYSPVLPKDLRSFKLLFSNTETLDVSFHRFEEEEEHHEEEEQKSDNVLNSNDEKSETSSQSNDNIEWNYSTAKGELKCREDKENNLNVLFMNDLYMEKDEELTIAKCAELFYSNDKQIVIITSGFWSNDNNVEAAYIYAQLLFPNLDIKFNMAMKQTPLNEKYFEANKNSFLDAEKCLPFNSWEDFIEENQDDYGEDIKHSRTKIYNPIARDIIVELTSKRKKIKNLGHHKKATDILILTDTVSYGATSIFMKTIQNNGGAIVAGYGGNPKNTKEYIKKLDASLEPIDTNEYSGFLISAKLAANGISFSIPYAETFENYKGDKYPLTFKVNPVDEVTDIYHDYNDNYYNEFIGAAKDILNKYTNQCNKDNLKLVLEDTQCKFDDENAHGGYKCSSEGVWTKECQKSYCEIGYFYDSETGNCIKDQCTNVEVIELYSEEQKIYDIKYDTTNIFKLNSDLYTYIFKSPIDNIILYPDLTECPRFCAFKNSNIKLIYVNYHRNLKNDIQIQIISTKTNLNAMSYKFDSPKYDSILPMPGNVYRAFQLTEDNYLYMDSFDKSSRFFYAVYDDNMTIDDIKNLNEKYFKEGLGQFLYLPKDQIYLGIFIQDLGFTKLYMHDPQPEEIIFDYGDKTILYLEENKKYTLNFMNNDLPVMIRLNEKKDTTLNVEANRKKETLSKTNKYFEPSEETFNETIKIETTNGALVEILYSFKQEETSIIKESVTGYVVDKNKKVTLIEYNPEKGKDIEISIESKEPFSFSTYGGLSKGIYFYHSKNNYPLENININSYTFKINNPLENINLEDGEKYIISLLFYKTNQAQEIKINVKYLNSPIEELYEPIEESYANDVISNLKSFLGYYIFKDIAQVPPEPNGLEGYVHSPIDFSQSLDNIEVNNRIFYDFYRDIIKIIGAPRDPHFSIYGLKTPKSNKFNYMTACLPFSFYVEKDEQKKAKMYVKYFRDCAIYFSEEIRNKIREASDKKIALERINGTDPFDYLQNWGREYRSLKSPHAHFTLVKRTIHAFYINIFPYKPEELHMTFKFENDEKEFELDYYIYIPNTGDMNNLLGSDILREEEFDEFFENESKQNMVNHDIPNIFEMIKRFKKSKGILEEEEKQENTEINWDYQTPEENGIKCRVDTENELNVIVQETFNLNATTAAQIIEDCAKKFHDNNYKVVVIENHNIGGSGELSIILRQLIQAKILNKAFMSYQSNDIFRKMQEEDPNKFIDAETCKPFDSSDTFINGPEDTYTDGEKNVTHKRTKVVDLITREKRQYLSEVMKNFKKENLKKPTDIIIFTDSHALSATSIFIKALQNEGGAITVGFNGNPFLDDELFDASQTPSPYYYFSSTQEYQNLENLGFHVEAITCGESFDYDYKQENPIPREYKLDPVDERSDIYEGYTDDKYSIFIEEAKRVFELYNEEDHCNPNNTNLVFEADDNCYNLQDENDKHAHGGYPCGDDGKWDRSKCKKYYCDEGYYYDKSEDKCKVDLCTHEIETIEITLNKEYEETIIINKDNNTEYIFTIDTTEYIYFFKSNTSGYIHYEINNPCSSLCVLQKNGMNHNNKVYLNINRNITENDIVIEIKSVKNFKGYIQSLEATNIDTDYISEIPEKIILIAEPKVDYIFYYKKSDDSVNYYYTEYKETITISDIVNINKEHFKEYKNSPIVFETNPNKIYIFVAESKTKGKFLEVKLQPKLIDKDIVIPSALEKNNIYLSKNDDGYNLDFSNNAYDRIIKLSKASIDSEIIIKNIITGKEVTLNSANSYYTFEETNSIFKDKLSIKVTKGNGAVLEFLSEAKDFEILSEKEYSNYKLSNYTIIKFEKNDKNENITIKLNTTSGKKFGYAFTEDYVKGNYAPIQSQNPPLTSDSNTYEFSIINKNENLQKDESYSVILYFNKDDLENEEILLTKTIQKDKPSGGDEPESEGLEGWLIAIIAIASVLIVLCIIIVIWKCVISKDKVESNDIGGSLVNKESELKELADQN